MTSSKLEPSILLVNSYSMQGTQIGTIITRFIAMDDDLSSNGALVYSLTQLSPTSVVASFSVHPLTGDLMVTRSLDLNTVYEIRVTAMVNLYATGCLSHMQYIAENNYH